MRRNAARTLVFNSLREAGLSPESLTPRTRLGPILQGEPRTTFVRVLNDRVAGLKVAPWDVSIRTVGQYVKMVSSQLPGDDDTPGPRDS